MRIAILEADVDQANRLNEALTTSGHICHLFAAGDQLVRRLRRETFDLLILEWVVPGMSGEDVLRWLRQNVTKWLPVLFVTSRGRESDIVSILNMGADDYLVKPVAMPILSARVETLLRRAYAVSPATTKAMFGEIEFNLELQQVHVNGTNRPVTQKEFALALLLFRNIGQPVSRAHICEAVWSQTNDIPSRTMDTHVTRVRSKLGLRPNSGYRLSCLYGYGYRLDAIKEEIIMEPLSS